MKKLLQPLSDADYCVIENLIREEVTALKAEKEETDNADHISLCDEAIVRYKEVLNRIKSLSEWTSNL